MLNVNYSETDVSTVSVVRSTRLLVGGIVAVAVFVVLAWWNGVVAVLFAIAVMTWNLTSLYRRSVGGDIFGDKRHD